LRSFSYVQLKVIETYRVTDPRDGWGIGVVLWVVDWGVSGTKSLV
jgi:hypothetical protein